MAVDISSWPTKTDVCQTLGLSLSQINNLIKQKRLEVRREKRFGAPPIGRINPKDVAREKDMREARDTQAHVMPAGAIMPSPQQRYDLQKSILRDASITDAEAIARLAAAQPRPLEHCDVLSIEEAARFKGYGIAWLEEQNANGKLPFYKVPGRRGRMVRRSELDQLGDVKLPTWPSSHARRH